MATTTAVTAAAPELDVRFESLSPISPTQGIAVKLPNPQKRQFLSPLPALQPSPSNGSSPLEQRGSWKHSSEGPAQTANATSR